VQIQHFNGFRRIRGLLATPVEVEKEEILYLLFEKNSHRGTETPVRTAWPGGQKIFNTRSDLLCLCVSVAIKINLTLLK